MISLRLSIKLTRREAVGVEREGQIYSALSKDRPHEASLIAEEALSFFVVFHCSLALRISSSFGSILFIGRKTIKRKQRVRNIAWSLMRHKVTVMSAAEFFNQRNPHFPVDFELF